MRVALVTAHYQPGDVFCGVGDYTRCLRQALERLGHECLVLTSHACRSDEKNVYRLSGLWGVRDLREAMGILRRNRLDMVILQYTPEQYGYGLFFKLLPLTLRWGTTRTQVVTTFHTLVGGQWAAKFYALLLAATSHKVVSVHAELSDLYRRHFPWWASKLREIPVGASISKPKVDVQQARTQLRQRLGLSGDTRILSTFGFPARGKGVDTLLHALRQLNEGSNVHLVCIGQARPGDQAFRQYLEDLVRHLAIDRHVHWFGEIAAEDVSDVLLGADAYVVPYDDGASLRRSTLLAGFQAGVPIVTTEPRYPDPALQSGKTMLIIPPKSPEALANCLEELFNNAPLQQALCQGVRKVLSRFSWEMIARQYEQCAMELEPESQVRG